MCLLGIPGNWLTLFEEIGIFEALCLYWCDVELHIAYLVSGNSLFGAKVFGDAFSGVSTMGVFWKIGFGERKFSVDWFSGREKFSGYEKHR